MALQVCDTIQRKEDLIDGIVKHSLAFEMSWYFKPWERFNQAIFGAMKWERRRRPSRDPGPQASHGSRGWRYRITLLVPIEILVQ